MTALRNAAFDRGWLSRRALPRPVVSVGNLAAGGSGKTPMVAALCEMLSGAGRRPVVLSRGYGRKTNALLRVMPDGDAATFGDEPLMLRRATGAQVWVSPDRYAAGMAALRELNQDPNIIFLLDDGFQHRRLRRDLDIVLIRRSDLHDALLPGGDLREPLSQLQRADVLAVEEEEADAALEARRYFVAPSCTRPALWTFCTRTELEGLAGRKIFAFCGIARPQRFFSALGSAHDAKLLGTRAFRDHHRYTPVDIPALISAARQSGADLLVTTEKDFARLSADQVTALSSAAELKALPLRLELSEPRLYLQQMLMMLEPEVRRG